MRKGFRLWLPLLSLAVCLFNVFGYDDKNILLFLTSPVFWLLESRSFLGIWLNSFHVPLFLIYILTLISWFLIGLLIDIILSVLFKRSSRLIHD
ncbi:hypothetical protein AS033_14075 [Exiguobacterium indicum]|uniref:Uncharacterized protein n=1 Tax=Exiguobacterium indicum TaxID=296995 RepID=A0A0V8GC35_9BACL|nr:hypothetical protein [Exiguobacterium enclense]KSU47787.1 hypothetical protein AS033_14075 [Exiguobacterium enclense]SDD25783.1 hypothetical protein SAMN05216342_2866 [Exiguobacterium enclense]